MMLCFTLLCRWCCVLLQNSSPAHAELDDIHDSFMARYQRVEPWSATDVWFDVADAGRGTTVGLSWPCVGRSISYTNT
jgi:hypothetical protein